MGQLPRPERQKLRPGRHLHPHRHRRGRHDGPTDLLPQRRRPNPGPDPPHQLRLAGHPAVRIGPPPQEPVHILERLGLGRTRIQVYRVIGQRLPRALIDQQPAPLMRPGHIDRLEQ